MGNSSSSRRLSDPPEFSRTFPLMRSFVEVAPGFWNIKIDFKVLNGLVNICSHMSICRLSSGDFVAIDTVDLSADAKRELDVITDNGSRLVAVLLTHPYHSTYAAQFHSM